MRAMGLRVLGSAGGMRMLFEQGGGFGDFGLKIIKNGTYFQRSVWLEAAPPPSAVEEH